MTQQMVGEAVGVQSPQVSGWESGKKTVREGHIDLYAAALGISRKALAQAILRHTQPILYTALFD